ncbi:hypothetical protein BG841_14220 [Marinobacter sp. X15-166B]|nr:hypothetical protein BG841_14220 [Marinobacter sp. X15-166B]
MLKHSIVVAIKTPTMESILKRREYKRKLEARAGIEPAYTELQDAFTAASLPLHIKHLPILITAGHRS